MIADGQRVVMGYPVPELGDYVNLLHGAECLCGDNRPLEADALYSQCPDFIQPRSYVELKGRVLSELVIAYAIDGNFERAEELFEMFDEEGANSTMRMHIGTAKTELAIANASHGNMEQAVEWLAWEPKFGDSLVAESRKEAIRHVTNQLTYFERRHLTVEMAQISLFEAIDEKKMEVLSKIGAVFAHRGDFRKAEKYLKKLRKNQAMRGVATWKAHLKSMIAHSYITRGQLSKARKWMSKIKTPTNHPDVDAKIAQINRMLQVL
ncbi:MAG: hypothetical protein S4CHLAM102_02940 [Chlamydiia bacterium]|nr:hypothetical protein [Chlamydiia bacterium]